MASSKGKILELVTDSNRLINWNEFYYDLVFISLYILFDLLSSESQRYQFPFHVSSFFDQR